MGRVWDDGVIRDETADERQRRLQNAQRDAQNNMARLMQRRQFLDIYTVESETWRVQLKAPWQLI